MRLLSRWLAGQDFKIQIRFFPLLGIKCLLIRRQTVGDRSPGAPVRDAQKKPIAPLLKTAAQWAS